MSCKIKFRVQPILTLAVLCLAAWFCITAYSLYQYLHMERGMEIVSLEGEPQKTAVDKFFSHSETVGQTSLVLIGVLWASVLSKDTAVELKSGAVWLFFISANLFFIESYLFYFFGYELWVGRLFYNSSFDLEAPCVRYTVNAQQFNFLAGLCSLLLTVFTGRTGQQYK